MVRKANWYDYIAAFIDPHTAIEDGYLVTANGLFDGGKSGTPLTPEQRKAYEKALWDLNYFEGDYGTDMSKAPRSIEDYVGTVTSQVPSSAKDFWDSLTPTEKEAYIDSYGINVSTEQILKDLTEVAALGKMPEVETFEMPLMSDYIQSDEDIYKDIDSELSGWYADASGRLNNSYNSTVEALNANEARLLSDLAEMSGIYSRQKDNLNDAFKQSSSNLRSQQYLANAQTYDALRSDLRRSRQNALEAGASAGVRIASNVNALLTAQNKQSATAMETSNALAEMLLQHRNAMSGITRDFANYRSGVNRSLSENDAARAKASETLNSGLNNLDTQRLGMRDTMYANRHASQTNNYNTAMTDYNAKTYNAGIGTNKWVEDIQAAEDAGNPFAGAYRNWARK